MDQSAVFMYLLVGDDKALLIDNGYGSLELKKIILSITDKEVLCACTHGHVDHALSAYQFKRHLHSDDHEVYKRHSAPDTIRSMGYKMLSLKSRGKALVLKKIRIKRFSWFQDSKDHE